MRKYLRKGTVSRNKDFNKKDEVSVAYEMKTPDKVLYKDINAMSLFPLSQGKPLNHT